MIWRKLSAAVCAGAASEQLWGNHLIYIDEVVCFIISSEMMMGCFKNFIANFLSSSGFSTRLFTIYYYLFYLIRENKHKTFWHMQNRIGFFLRAKQLPNRTLHCASNFTMIWNKCEQTSKAEKNSSYRNCAFIFLCFIFDICSSRQPKQPPTAKRTFDRKMESGMRGINKKQSEWKVFFHALNFGITKLNSQ